MRTTFPAYPDIVKALEHGSTERMLPGGRDPALYQRHAAALDAVEADLRAALPLALPALPWSKFRLFEDFGNRTTFEKPFFLRRVRLAQLVLLVLAGRDADGTLLHELEDVLWETCNEYTWALPAHLWRAGSPRKGFRDAPRMLDLFASETGYYLAETLHLLGDRLDPRVVARVREQIRYRILDSYLGPYETPWWAGGTNNWGAVCAGSIGATFLYEETNPDRLRIALVQAIGTMESFVRSFPEDGTCEEGFGYWNYGFGYYALFAELLRDYTGGEIDLFAAPGVERIAAFPHRVRLNGRRVVSFSDGDRFGAPRGWLPTLLHRRFPSLPKTSGTVPPVPFAAKLGHVLRNFLYCDPADAAEPLPDAVEHFPDAQWLVVRRGAFGFGAQFGSNFVSHNHNDVGSFLLVSDDREGPMDLGSGVYTRQYFGAERYSDAILCCGSQGHSLPMVGGATQKAGREFRASDVTLERSPDDAEIVFSGDIAGAYGLPALRSLRRTFRVRPGEGAVTVTDEFSHEGGLPETVERFIGYEKPEILEPGRARFGAFEARFDPALAAEVRTLPFHPHGAGSGKFADSLDVYALDIALPAGFEGAFTVEFRA